MEKGRILQVADPKTLYEAPASRKVAEFIGTMNFFEARVVVVSSTAAAVSSPALGNFQVRLRAGFKPQLGAFVLAAIRPERLSLSREPPTRGLEGRLASIAYLGDRDKLRVTVPGARSPVIVSAQNLGAANGSLQPGDAVYLSWSPEAVVLLAKD
jgi:ABC-type Fe3+/spermidine/putrescine transport system ATPase subunit